MESTNNMIDYNLIVYIGIVLMVLIFILFIANEMNKRKLDIELFKQQQQLRKSIKLGQEMAIDLIDTRNKLNHLRKEKNNDDTNKSN